MLKKNKDLTIVLSLGINISNLHILLTCYNKRDKNKMKCKHNN